MFNHTKYILFAVIISFYACSDANKQEKPQLIYPVKDYHELFVTVQKNHVFSDSKKFNDCVPLKPIDAIVKAYNVTKTKPDFNLKEFVSLYFDTLTNVDETYETDPTHSITQHINTLWRILTKEPKEQQNSSLIALPKPYVAPGGRFNEIYYWDSYFTMLGLQVDGNVKLIKNMADNFSYLIDSFGFIPNGNRSYYLTRSQPPFFSLITEIISEIEGEEQLIKYLPELVKEYNFWMKGNDKLSAKARTTNRVVWINDSVILNRYWDNACEPRPESYREDVKVYKESGRDSSIFRDIRAAAESGWDFSSRWFGDGQNLSTINTTQIIPVDLNCLLYNLELTISKGYLYKSDTIASNEYFTLSETRKTYINNYLWNKNKGFYFDYNFVEKKQSDIYSLAGVYPLFFGISDSLQALYARNKIANDFLMQGGVVTTLTKNVTGQQWDYPNGWAPLQWITCKGLLNYGYHDLAKETALRWTNLNEQVFYGRIDSSKEGKMLEKYNVVNNLQGAGGEYNLQDGFGWTNGVYLKLSQLIIENE